LAPAQWGGSTVNFLFPLLNCCWLITEEGRKLGRSRAIDGRIEKEIDHKTYGRRHMEGKKCKAI
jgi:hypothetical protein